MKGVMYSPSPMGSHPVWTWPHGDFFLPQYSDLWARDFPILRALGANTIRVSGWNNELDHGYFLDQAHQSHLKVIVTFHMGNVWENPVASEWQRQGVRGKLLAHYRELDVVADTEGERERVFTLDNICEFYMRLNLDFLSFFFLLPLLLFLSFSFSPFSHTFIAYWTFYLAIS